MRKFGQVDKNQNEIVDALRRVGAKVQSLASVGDGCPDLLVGFRGVWYVMEVKNDQQPLAKRALTDDEFIWWEEAQLLGDCKLCVVENWRQALLVIGAIA